MEATAWRWLVASSVAHHVRAWLWPSDLVASVHDGLPRPPVSSHALTPRVTPHPSAPEPWRVCRPLALPLATKEIIRTMESFNANLQARRYPYS